MAVNQTAAQKKKEAELKAKQEAEGKVEEGSPEAIAQLAAANEQTKVAKKSQETEDEGERDLSTIVVMTGYGRYNSPLGLLVNGQEFNAGTKENVKKLCRMKNSTTGAKIFTPAEEYYDAQDSVDDDIDLNAIAGNAGNQRGGVEEV